MNIPTEFIYLLKEREFIKTNESILKIGRSGQSNLKRINAYPKDSILLYYRACIDSKSIENIVKKLFITKYKQRKDIGAEYFEGDFIQMINDIHCVFTQNLQLVFDYEQNIEDCENKIIKEQSIYYDDLYLMIEQSEKNGLTGGELMYAYNSNIYKTKGGKELKNGETEFFKNIENKFGSYMSGGKKKYKCKFTGDED